ncbi:metallopeptidase family M84 protein [Rhizoctonia solani AG-3 Rhs1AP]|uniref:Metallopeptidase family M84 protein n=2 Tax=Rhizoctonia solani AG-3 TaxID=1086053 RepID=A0A074RU30_9AGAM|nr:metallopeptidase family M84 protein [Rhizoctonia solani AG-3 Rhs1AP]KEP50404.1 metallopeptidase family M84 protein [Rhizoctonia solani 123E]
MVTLTLLLTVALTLTTMSVAHSSHNPTLISRDSTDLECGDDNPPDSADGSPIDEIYLEPNFPPAAPASYVVNVYWNVIYKNTTYNGGFLSSTQVDSAIATLNSQFMNTGLTFQRAALNYTENAEWFDNVDTKGNSTLAATMKNTLHVGAAKDLNIYSVGFTNAKLGGFATFPWWYVRAPKLDGVVFKWNTTPGGSRVNYNQGKILAHEVGHWAGLYHTFQGGCSGSEGDFVSDTPAQAKAATGCPVNRNSCPNSVGSDPTHNLMDYTYDACKTDPFTEGQISRMKQTMQLYRANEG